MNLITRYWLRRLMLVLGLGLILYCRIWYLPVPPYTSPWAIALAAIHTHCRLIGSAIIYIRIPLNIIWWTSLVYWYIQHMGLKWLSYAQLQWHGPIHVTCMKSVHRVKRIHITGLVSSSRLSGDVAIWFCYCVLQPLCSAGSAAGYGITTNGYTTFINASMCTLQYKPVQKPIIFDLPNKEWRVITSTQLYLYVIYYWEFYVYYSVCSCIYIDINFMNNNLL